MIPLIYLQILLYGYCNLKFLPRITNFLKVFLVCVLKEDVVLRENRGAEMFNTINLVWLLKMLRAKSNKT